MSIDHNTPFHFKPNTPCPAVNPLTPNLTSDPKGPIASLVLEFYLVLKVCGELLDEGQQYGLV